MILDSDHDTGSIITKNDTNTKRTKNDKEKYIRMDSQLYQEGWTH